MISVGVVFYGDHPDLAKRLLDSLGDGWFGDVRIGFNETCAETLDAVYRFANGIRVPVYGYFPARNVGKYPLLRCFLHGRQGRPGCGDAPPLDGSDVYCHFDDDSYVVNAPRLTDLAEGFVSTGAWYELNFFGDERQFIQRQPWYGGVPWYWSKKRSRERFFFPTGGWWTCRVDFLRKWDFPFPELHHNGGDALFGELLRQQRAATKHVDDGAVVRINQSKRRGLSLKRLWVDRNVDYSKTPHQEFEITIRRLNG